MWMREQAPVSAVFLAARVLVDSSQSSWFARWCRHAVTSQVKTAVNDYSYFFTYVRAICQR